MRGTRLSGFHGNPEILTIQVNRAMDLTEEDKYLTINEVYEAIRLIKEFPGQNLENLGIL